jgi:hypothetical protein
MIDETDISQEMKWFYEERARTAVASFNKRGINAQYVPTRQEAFSTVMAMIPEGATVVRGDSITLEQVGVIETLTKNKKYKFINAHARTEEGHFVLNRESIIKVLREGLLADVLITGSNAVTLDGKLVNIDGFGNRVAGMIFGPDKVIVVAGANKITRDVTEALERVQQVAAPLNARRHYLKHKHSELGDLPCVKMGRCVDCNRKWKICRFTVIIDGPPIWLEGRINVVLVGEVLGL